MAMARLRAALPSAPPGIGQLGIGWSGIGTNGVQEGFNQEPDTGSQGGCEGKTKQSAEDHEHNG
jgi:hypothetical protein